MGKQLDYRFERLYRALWTSRQIQNQRFSAHSAYTTAEGGERSFLGAFGSHTLGNAFQQAFTHAARGFRGDVACGDPGSTGRDHQPRFCCPTEN